MDKYVRPDNSKIAAWQWKHSQHQFKDKEESQNHAGTHRIFIPDYATVAAPLTELTKKATPNKVIWSDVCEEALQTRSLCTSPVLKCPDFQLPFILQTRTDASNWGVGGVLSQVDERGQDHPVAYFSRKLLARERRYSTIN